MAHVSLYRKYRSQTFGDLIGQDHVVRTLQNAISGGRIAHAYLFTGPRGTGKTSTARLLAKALCCEKGPTPEPCGECDLCLGVADGSLMDVREVDAASEAGVDNVRESIIDVAEYVPTLARFKIFIIDEVHDLSPKAFDALLKTIEEPPSHVIFILATTEYVKVPPTIRSRCQKFEFHRGSLTDLQGRLAHVADAEGLKVEPAALSAIARMADGGFRDALTLLEQARLAADETITLDLVYDQLGMVAEEVSDRLLIAVRKADDQTILATLAELARRGRDPRAILESMVVRAAELTNMLFGLEHGVDASSEAAAHATAVELGKEALVHMRGQLADSHRAIGNITLPRLWLESELLRLAHPAPVAQAQPATPAQTPRAEATKPQPAPRSEPARAVAETSKQPEPAQPKPTQAIVAEGTDPRWSQVLNLVQAKSKALFGRITAATTQLEGTTLTLGFERKMDLDWVSDDVRKLGMLRQFAQEIYGPEIEVRAVHQAKTQTTEAPPVELMLKGKELYDAAREEFQGYRKEQE